MKKQLLFMLMATLAISLSSCVKGDGHLVTEYPDLEPIEGISLQISEHVYIEYGMFQHVEIRGEENIIELLNMDVDNGIWEIKFDKSVGSHEELQIYIRVPDLEVLNNTGSGEIDVTSAMAVNDLEINNTGSGNIDAHFTGGTNFDINITGSGDVDLVGDVTTVDLSMTGSGDLNAHNLLATAYEATLTGSGNAYIYTSSAIDATLSGSGNIYYKGFPTSVSYTATGSGSVYDAN